MKEELQEKIQEKIKVKIVEDTVLEVLEVSEEEKKEEEAVSSIEQAVQAPLETNTEGNSERAALEEKILAAESLSKAENSNADSEIHRASYTRRFFAWFIDNLLVCLACLIPIGIMFGTSMLLAPELLNSGRAPSFWEIIGLFLVGTIHPSSSALLSIVLPFGQAANFIQQSVSTHNINFSIGLGLAIYGCAGAVNFLGNIIYHTLMPLSGLKGTVGQKILGIKTRWHNNKPSLKKAFARATLKVIAIAILALPLTIIFFRAFPLAMLIMFLSMIFDKRPIFSRMRTGLDNLSLKLFGLIPSYAKGSEVLRDFKDARNDALKSPEKRAQTHKDHIIIRYKPYAAISRWFEQRFSQTNQWTSLGIVLGSFALFFLLYAIFEPSLTAAGLTWDNIQQTLARFAAQGAGGVGGTAAGGGSVSSVFFSYSLAAIFIVSTLALIKFFVQAMLKPTHLRFDEKGLTFQRFNEATKSFVPTSSNRWEDLTHVALQRVSGRSIDSEPSLILSWANGQTSKLDLSSVPTMDEKALILKAVDRWRKDVPIDAEVISSLEVPPEYSYTEVWLQALCAPPKRERLKPLLAGASLKDGQYKIEKQLGAGGQGVAYLTHDHSSGRMVVLKEMLLPVFVDMTVRKQALDRFEGECRILRSLDHAKVVSLSDFFVEDHRAYLVLEYIEGRNLKEEIKQGREFKAAEIKSLALEMCDILEYLHGCEPPVVHRDFTPDNLMLTSEGSLKLIDFNVANQQEQTATGTVVGKQAYMPLEQFQGNPTPQSDIYAMGATLYYLLTGEEPEPLTTSHPAQSPAFRLKDLDQESIKALNEIVAKATNSSLEKRFQNIDELRTAIKAINL
ncbi:MAG: protein kinase [Candidatus Melainabacteria bacterium]|nr:protein kinase [Candidatus Melainabacteria bacterium]